MDTDGIFGLMDIVSYALLESAVRPAIHLKSYRSHEGGSSSDLDDKWAFNNISYDLLESAIRPDIQPKPSRSNEAEPSVIWMTEGG